MSTHQNTKSRTANRVLLAVLALWMVGSIGCAAQRVTVRNESESDMTIRLFVGDREDPRADDEGRVPLYHTEKHLAHLKTGRSHRFKLRKNKYFKREARDPVIRLWIESRAPVFAQDRENIREHWIELVSFPPVTITVTGEKNDLKFAASKGEITLVPKELWLDDPNPANRLRQATVTTQN